jgi:Xaa-Pro aminopeptidase
LFLGYAVITVEDATLYVNGSRFSDGVVEILKADAVAVKPYEALFADVASTAHGSAIWLDPAVCNYAILAAIETARSGNGSDAVEIKTIMKPGPIPLAKARKNDVELAGSRLAHIRDGVAMAKFLCWLENEVSTLGNTPTECEAAEKLDGLREAQDLFVSLSFPTISSSGSNGAIIHYRPMPETCAKIDKDHVYLVDSGAQYRDGTTDVTRTMHFGTPTDWQMECWTRVLQGHIALDTAVFPKGTTGFVLDAFARKPLWAICLDYKHGTGHGVGAFSNVHEGPHSLSTKQVAHATPLEPGFLTSNEPGYYETGVDGKAGFGIRIETVCHVVHNGSQGTGKEKIEYYGLVSATLVPLQAKMMKLSLLSEAERQWLDAYHTRCYETLSPMLVGDPTTLEWLRVNSQKISARTPASTDTA